VKDAWLPPGKFVDLTDLVEYEGGKRVSIPAPLGKLPLLLKEGGIVPLLDPTIETLAPATEPGIVTPETVKDVLDVAVALSANQEARITLADGTELFARRGTAGAAGRTQVESALEPATLIEQDDLVLQAKGPVGRRIRWDVVRLR
jgi:alpha-D-xyloside xylohydrolase